MLPESKRAWPCAHSTCCILYRGLVATRNDADTFSCALGLRSSVALAVADRPAAAFGGSLRVAVHHRAAEGAGRAFTLASVAVADTNTHEAALEKSGLTVSMRQERCVGGCVFGRRTIRRTRSCSPPARPCRPLPGRPGRPRRSRCRSSCRSAWPTGGRSLPGRHRAPRSAGSRRRNRRRSS